MARRVTSDVFVGRRSELERFAELLAASTEGEAAVALITGDAGIGKSRFLTEALEHVDASGVTVLLGHCIDFGSDVLPYAPIVDALRRLAATSDLTELVHEDDLELRQLIPEVGTPPPRGFDADRTLLFTQVLRIFRRLSEQATLLLAVEDVHWADTSTRTLLSYLIHHLRRSPVLFALTFRSDELHRRHPIVPWLGELERSARPETIQLDPLTEAEVQELIRHVTDGPPSIGMTHDIYTRSAGNPFFVEELFAASAQGQELPTSVRHAVRARFRDLDDQTMWLLRAAAASQAHIDPELLADLASVRRVEVDAAMRTFADRGVMVLDRSGSDLTFRHDLVREVLYDDLLPGERAQLHARLAEALQARADKGEPVHGELAHHWRAVGETAKALRASIMAANTANAMAAPAEALTLYERSVDLWEQVEDPARVAGIGRTELMVKLGHAAAGAGSVESAIAVLRREVQDAELTLDERITLLEEVSRLLWLHNDPEAYDADVISLALLDEASDPLSQARIKAIVTRSAMIRWDLRTVEEHVDGAIRDAERSGDRLLGINLRTTKGTADASLGRAQGVAMLRANLADAVASDHFVTATRAHVNLSHALNYIGLPQEALEVCDAALEWSRASGLRGFFPSLVRLNRCHALTMLGRWDEVLDEDLIRVVTELRWETSIAGDLIAYVMIASGHFERARAILESAHERLATIVMQGDAMLETHAGLAALAIEDGELETARTHVATAIDWLADRTQMAVPRLVALGARVEADAALRAAAHRQEAEAADRLQNAGRLIATAQDAVDISEVDIPFCADTMQAWLDQARAEQARGEGDDGPATWVELAERWQSLYEPLQVPYCHLRAAEAMLREGDRVRARDQLLAGRGAAVALGAKPTVDACDALAARGRIVIDVESDSEEGPAEPAPFDLTPREREVTALLARGFTNQQIADELFISVKTAGNHVSHILTKMEVANRGEAAAIAHRLGLD